MYALASVERASDREQRVALLSSLAAAPPHSDQWTDNETNVEEESSQSYASVPSPSRASRIHSTPYPCT